MFGGGEARDGGRVRLHARPRKADADLEHERDADHDREERDGRLRETRGGGLADAVEEAKDARRRKPARLLHRKDRRAENAKVPKKIAFLYGRFLNQV